MGQRTAYTLRKFKKGDLCPKCGEGYVKSDGVTVYCSEVGCGHSEPSKEAKTTDNQQLNLKLDYLIRRTK